MSELKEKYIQFCCAFYNEHAPENKLWFGRMFEQCQEDYEQQNRCMYRWQFPLMILKSQQTEIDQLKADLALCREENKGLIESLNKERAWAVEISSYATELAQYASYAEIIGAISHNRQSIREYCDKVFAFNRANPDEETLRGGHESN